MHQPITRRAALRGAALTAAVAGIARPRPAEAHHGWGGYDASKVLTLTGTIQESAYSNPHGEMRLAVADKIWRCVLAPPFRMQNRGLTEAMMKPGTQAVVVGYPHKSDPVEMRAERITINGITTELR